MVDEGAGVAGGVDDTVTSWFVLAVVLGVVGFVDGVNNRDPFDDGNDVLEEVEMELGRCRSKRRRRMY